MSVRGLWYSLRAGVYVFDCRIRDVSAVAGHGAIKLNLWHGVPLKVIERDIVQAHHPIVQARSGPFLKRVLRRSLFPDLTERYDFLLATSEATAKRFASAFGMKAEQIITAGYPRTDPLLARGEIPGALLPAEQEFVREFRWHAAAGRRVVFYMPTFRDWRNVADRPIPINWVSVNRILGACGGVLYCKLHPNDQARLPSLDGLENIRIVPSSVDPYPLLRHTDALITDYSSIFFDYLLLDKPILFYPYDLEDYQLLSRTLYDPYEQVTPGPKAYNALEFEGHLTQLISNLTAMRDAWREHRARVRLQAHAFCDAGASERLFNELLRQLELTT